MLFRPAMGFFVAAACLLVFGVLAFPWTSTDPSLDVLITGGRIVDGTGGRRAEEQSVEGAS
jgi:hypothetical protein